MQLSGLGLGEWAAWAFWPSLALSCSGLRTQTKEVSEEAASSTALKLGMEPECQLRGSNVTALVCLFCAHP